MVIALVSMQQTRKNIPRGCKWLNCTLRWSMYLKREEGRPTSHSFDTLQGENPYWSHLEQGCSQNCCTWVMVQPLVRTRLVKTRNHARCCRCNLSYVKSLSKARCILMHNDKNNQTNRGIFKQSMRCFLEGMVIVAPYCWSINLNQHSIWGRCNKKRKTKHPFMSGKKRFYGPGWSELCVHQWTKQCLQIWVNWFKNNKL